MKLLFFLLLACLTCLLPSYALSPMPTTVDVHGGSLSFDADARIFYDTRTTSRSIENSLQPLALVLAGELEAVTGIKPPVIQRGGGNLPGPGDISLEFQGLTGAFAASEELEDQSYTLEVSDRVTVRSQYYKGVAYGTTTLLHSIVENGNTYSLPRVAISDAPAAEYRAVMIDLARQPSSLASVREVVRLARQYKLRYLHLHLTDDQHFTFPFTPVTSKLAGNFTYNRAALVELAAYADAHGVTIIPELDLPGHSSRLRDSGYLNPSANDADVAHPNNYAKIGAIIDDMLEVFPSSPYFHIGGDESGAGNALVPFLAAMNQHVRSKPPGQKKRLIVWEGFHGSPTTQLPATGDDRIVVISWESSYNPPWSLLNSGYQIINASWKPLYVVGSGATHRGPHTAQRMWSPQQIHLWNKNTFMHWEPGRPVFEDSGPGDTNLNDGTWDADAIGKTDQVIGGQMLSWEQNEKTIVRDLIPRLPAMADRLWNPIEGETTAEFIARLDAVRERALTIVQPVEILPAGLQPESPLAEDYRSYSGPNVEITLRNRTKIPGTIRYTTGTFNNSRLSPDFEFVPETTASSSAYTGPFVRSGGFGIRAALYRADDGTKVEGHDWQHYNNWENVVEVTEYQVPRRPLETVPDFASFTNDKITRVYQLPALRGPYLVDQVYGQMFRATLEVPGTGNFNLSMQTSDGRSSVYIDLNKDGIWDPSEKVIANSPPNDIPVHTTVPLVQGSYNLRVDHASGAIGPILWLKLDGPGTGGNKDVTEFLSLPVDPNAPPAVPQLQSPANGASRVRPGSPLTWTSAGASSYDVYLWPHGTVKPEAPTAPGLATNLFVPEELALSTTYEWSVVATNQNGSVESARFQFTTSDDAGPGPSIGWNYVGLGGGKLAATDIAGAPGYQQGYWNNHAGVVQAPGIVPFDLVDATGAPAGARVTAWTQSSNNSWKHDNNSTPDHALTNDFADREPSITFSGIPYDGYDVVVYYGNNEGPSTSVLHVGNQSRSIRTGNTAQSYFGNVGYVEGTDDNPNVPTNYSVFQGLSGPTLTVSLVGANNNGISAIQIVKGEAQPESTTPATPTNPLDGATGFKPWQPLAWNAGGAGEIAYDVFLWPVGTAKPSEPVATVESLRYFPDTYLVPGQQYRWQIVTQLQSGATLSSDEFGFTVGTLTGQPPFDISAAGRAAREEAVDAMKGIAMLVGDGGSGTPIPDGARLAFYGDSITDVFTYYDVLQSALQQAKSANPRFPDVEFLNRGINGGTSEDLLSLPLGDRYPGGSGPNPPKPFVEQVDADLAALPTGSRYVAIIQIGVNDVYQGLNTSKEVYKARLEQMTDYVLGKGHLVVLVSPTVINEAPIADITDDGLYDDAGNALLNQYVVALSEIASSRGIPFVNQRQAYLNIYRNENFAVSNDAAGSVTYPLTTGILNSDAVHPNARGKALSSELVAKGIFEAFAHVSPPGEIEVSPASIDFGGQNVGVASMPRSVIIRNLHSENPLVVSQVSVGGANAGEFNATGGGVIAPGGTLEVKVTFKPIELGTRSSELRILSNDEDHGVVTVLLSGNGVAVPPAAPAEPSPAHQSEEIPTSTSFDWRDTSGATSYDVFVWIAGETPPSLPVAVVAESEYSPGGLLQGTTYLWKVVSRNAAGVTEGPVWTFSTRVASFTGIGWNYVGVGEVALAPGDEAGAPGYEQSNWNNHFGVGQGPGSVPFALADHSAAATSARVTAWTQTSNNSWQHGQIANPHEILMNDFIDRQPSVTISNIPYARYDVVVYYGNNEGPSTSTLGVIGSGSDSHSRSVITGNTALSSFRSVGYREETGSLSGPTNFTVFRGLADSQIRVFLSGDNNNGISAIQVVDAPMPGGGFADWQRATPGAGTTPDANLDRDSWSDLIEYAFGGDPASGVAPPGLPRLAVTAAGASLIYQRPAGISDLSYQLEGSIDGTDWHPIHDIEPTIVAAGAFEQVSYPDLFATSDLPGLPPHSGALFRLVLSVR
jgi:lysophospholipase L1-like esterase